MQVSNLGAVNQVSQKIYKEVENLSKNLINYDGKITNLPVVLSYF